MGNRYLIANDRNKLATASLTPSSIKPASNTILPGRLVRSGSGTLSLSGAYTGSADATLEVEIMDLDTSDEALISTPVGSGPGNGTVTTISTTGLDAQTITLDLISVSPAARPAAVTVADGIELRHRVAGDAGNVLTLTITPALTFTLSDYTVLETLAAGTATVDSTLLGALEWECAVAGPDGIVPSTAKRVRFGDINQTIYVNWKSYLPTGWRYYFDPPLATAVAAGTPIYFVTGDYTADLTDGVTTETYDNLVTLYDLLRALQGSALIEVVGVIAEDRRVGGQALRELPIRTDARVLTMTGSGSKYATGFASITLGPAWTATEIITATCWAVSSKDHPDAKLGHELWTLSGSLSGLIQDTLATGEAFLSTVVTDPGPPPVIETAFGLTIPIKLPPGYTNQRGQFRLTGLTYADAETRQVLPKICLEKLTLGVAAEDQTLTLIYTKRPTGICNACAPATIQGALSAKLLGLDSIAVQPPPPNTENAPDEYVELLDDLAEDTQNNSYYGSVAQGAFVTADERFFTQLPYTVFNSFAKLLEYRMFYYQLTGGNYQLITSEGGPWQYGYFSKAVIYFPTDLEADTFQSALQARFSAALDGADWKVYFTLTADDVDYWSNMLLTNPTTPLVDNQAYTVVEATWHSSGTYYTFADKVFATQADALQWIDDATGAGDPLNLPTSKPIDAPGWMTANSAWVGNENNYQIFGSYTGLLVTNNNWARTVFHSVAAQADYGLPLIPVQIGSYWYLQLSIADSSAATAWQALSVNTIDYENTAITSDGPEAGTDYLLTFPNNMPLPTTFETRPVFDSEADAQDFIDGLLAYGSSFQWKHNGILLDYRAPLPPYQPFLTVVDEVFNLRILSGSSAAALALWLNIWTNILSDGADIIAGTLDGYDPDIRDRYAADLEDLQDLLYDGADIWKDWGDGFYWVINGGEFLPAFTNHVYHSAIVSPEGFPRPAKQFALVVKVADDCVGYLREGDRITLAIGNAAQPATYQVGDQLTVSLVAAQPLLFKGGLDGENTQEWAVTGSVDGPFPRYLYDADLPAAYNENGLTFLLSPGALPFAKGSRITFDIEGGHYRWRKNGGAWSALAPISETPATLTDALDLTMTTGAAPSFAVGDLWSWQVYQPWAATGVLTPDSASWAWSGTGANIVFDLGSDQTISVLAMARHVLPVGATLLWEGGTVAGVYTWSQAMTLQAGVMVTTLAVAKVARYLRVTVATATGGTIGWLWAGVPLAPDISGDLKLQPTWRLLRADTSYNTGGSYLGVGTDATLTYPLGALTQTEYTNFMTMISALKAGGDYPLILVPHRSSPTEAVLVQLGEDTLDLSDYLDYGGASTNRAYGLKLAFRGWVF